MKAKIDKKTTYKAAPPEQNPKSFQGCEAGKEIKMKENTQFIIEELNEKVFFNYNYNVKVITDGYYCGIGNYCKSLKEALDFIKKYEKGE